MKTTLATLAAGLLLTGTVAAQQTRPQTTTSRPDAATMTTATNTNAGTGNTLEQNSNASVTTGAANNAAVNPSQPGSSSAQPNNGTNAQTGLNGTLEQNSNGTVSANAPTTTTTDARSSTITGGTTVKAKKKRGELVNLKKNQ